MLDAILRLTARADSDLAVPTQRAARSISAVVMNGSHRGSTPLGVLVRPCERSAQARPVTVDASLFANRTWLPKPLSISMQRGIAQVNSRTTLELGFRRDSSITVGGCPFGWMCCSWRETAYQTK